jgi:hypothetical protein
MRWSDVNSTPKYKLISDTPDPETLKMVQSLNEKDVSSEEVVEIVPSGETTPLTADIQEAEPSESLIHHYSTRTYNLSITLKQIRRVLEEKYEVGPAGLPFSVVELLHHGETQLCLERHPTTDSIWNIDHQRHRLQAFEERDIGIVWRQKCSCDMETPLKGSIHAMDPYCPRNIPANDDELEWDEEEGKWVEKKTPRPTSPAEEESDTEEKEEEEVEEKKEEKMAKALSSITEMVGLNTIKIHVQKLNTFIETSFRQGVNLEQERFGTVFFGSTGTGQYRMFHSTTLFH